MNQLSKRERIALEAYYKHGLTYSQVGEMIGNVSRQRARNITIQALKKFRQAAVLKTCHISQILENNKKLTTLLQEKNKTILQLRIELESLKNGNIKIADMHFSTKVYHALLNANLFDTDRILRINHSNELLQVNRIGEYSLKEILHKMREYGFNGWADKIESTINLPTYHYFQNLCPYPRIDGQKKEWYNGMEI